MSRMSDTIEPTLAAAQQRIATIDPAAYARSRNSLDGAVTRLSPYITHGLVSPTAVAAAVAQRHSLTPQHKLVQELGWRAFFHHVANHRGAGILQSLHAGAKPDADYLPQLPDDIRQARSGVPAIDMAVRTLYASGWLHNHARMWLASYVVHVRGVHWRAGADWLLAHLVDGDRASNHLSWQWIAGTASHKPYLFNADNVARYAGAGFDGWLGAGRVMDCRYDQLDAWAHGRQRLPIARPLPAEAGVTEPALWRTPPPGLSAPPPDAVLAEALAGRQVLLVHPWALAEPEPADTATLRLGVWPADHFAHSAWSLTRWQFVAPRMAAVTQHQVWADGAQLQQLLQHAAGVRTTHHPELPAAWPAAWRHPAPLFVPEPARPCHSFSQFWRAALQGITTLDQLPGWPLPRQPDLFGLGALPPVDRR